MNQSRLKTIRLILAMVFFPLTAFIFLDFRDMLPGDLYGGITFLQFVPSLLKAFTYFGLTALGFIMIIVLTSLFGRVYCSMVCPLGILQDLMAWIRRKVTKRKLRFRYRNPNPFWRYFFLLLPLTILLAGGGLIGVYLLDPYSIFGRICSDLGQPVYMWINNRLAGLMETMNIYLLNPEDIVFARVLAYILPSVMLLIILWFSLKHGRLYCNTVCPVGTLLGLISKFSLLKISIREEICTKCGRCVAKCKASCIDIKNLAVDTSRCVGCYNCIQECPQGAIGYAPAWSPGERQLHAAPAVSKVHATPVNNKRREAIFKILGVVLAVTGLSRGVSGQDLEGSTGSAKGIKNKIPTKIKPDKHFPVSPPGSLGIAHFTNHCTACHLCVSACPTGVLQASLTEYGLSGILQPHMDYSTRYCNFECTLCSEVCPTGAILYLSGEDKKTTQVGKVHFIIENCIVKAEQTACGSCSEHCPTQAVTMIPYEGNLTIPQIRPEICIGCGACEYACPVEPHKAIYVDGNEVHLLAEKPQVEKLEETTMDEFPF